MSHEEKTRIMLQEVWLLENPTQEDIEYAMKHFESYKDLHKRFWKYYEKNRSS